MSFETLVGNFSKLYPLDIRVLRFARILLALLLIYDLGIRSEDLSFFYSDEGVFPLRDNVGLSWNNYTLMFINSDVWFVRLHFMLNIIAYVLLLLGWRANVFSFISLILLISLQNRNPYVYQSGDVALRLLLFWGMFLPWDRKSNLVRQGFSHFGGLSGLGLIISIGSVYFFSALYKFGSDWYPSFNALYYALQLDIIVLPFGKWLRNYNSLLPILTGLVYYVELFVPLLLLIPIKNQKFRLVFIVIFSVLQLGISISLFVGLFYLIMMVCHVSILNIRKVIRDKIYVPSIIHQGLAVFFIVYMLMLNITSLPYFPYEIDERTKIPAHLLGIHQNWNMFAPNVLKNDGWIVIEAKTQNNEIIDLQKPDQPLDSTKPIDLVSTYKNDRHRKYYEFLTTENTMNLAYKLLKYRVKEWNQQHKNNQIMEAKVNLYEEYTPPPGIQYDKVHKKVLAAYKNKNL